MKVVLGVTGGIAAYKVTEVIRGFKKLGHEVFVIPTANALKFVGKATLEALSGNTVDDDVFSKVESVNHVRIGQSADLVVIAPATASFLARYAAGSADDLLCNTLLATKAPVLVAPAMHSEMWQNPATEANVQTLRNRGVQILEPDVGALTSGDVGVGRLPTAESIVGAALGMLRTRDLTGKKILVTAGGTRAKIDAVRFLGNFSSGKQGIAVAEQAQVRGAEVTLVLANVEANLSVRTINVSSNAELEAAVQEHLPKQDVLIMAAAIADFELEKISETKLKRNHGNFNLEFRSTKDLLAEFSKLMRSSNPNSVVVGFAAEPLTVEPLVNSAQEKLIRKGCDLVVANDVSDGKIFGRDQTEIHVVGSNGLLGTKQGTKSEAANYLLDEIVRLL